MRTTCEYNPVQRTLRNSPDFEGRAEDISGKYAISCFGGPEGILGSLAKRIADCEKAFLAEAEARCLEECVKMDREIAVLSIVIKKKCLSEALRMMKFMPRCMTSMIEFVLAPEGELSTSHSSPPRYLHFYTYNVFDRCSRFISNSFFQIELCFKMAEVPATPSAA